MRGRHDLTDAEWAIISPLPPDKPRGVPRVDDRRAISGIFHILRTGTPWRDLPERCGPHATVCNRWARQGVRERLFGALAEKRGSGSRHRTLARRAEHQNPRRRRRPWPAAPSSNALPTMALAPTSRPNGIAGSSAPHPITCTANATSSNVSSTSSSTSEASRPAITSSQETSSPQSPSPASASGSKIMSTRPSWPRRSRPDRTAGCTRGWPGHGEAWRRASKRCDRTRFRAASATAGRRCRCNGWPSDRRPRIRS